MILFLQNAQERQISRLLRFPSLTSAFWGDENVPKLIVVITAQLNILKISELYILSR